MTTINIARQNTVEEGVNILKNSNYGLSSINDTLTNILGSVAKGEIAFLQDGIFKVPTGIK
jgi:hypothetical protein